MENQANSYKGKLYLIDDKMEEDLQLHEISSFFKSTNGKPRLRWTNKSEIKFFSISSWRYFFSDTYEGDIVNDLPNGYGILTIDEDRKYVGNWKDGLFHGYGEFNEYKKEYKGEWKNGEKHGHGEGRGTYLSIDIGGHSMPIGGHYGGHHDGHYVGDWKHGKENGKGIIIFDEGSANRRRYEGQFKDGIFHGKGEYENPNQWSRYYKNDEGNFDANYIGEWKNGKKHGHGVETFKGGKLRCGTIFHGGSKYDGTWRFGKEHGQGELECPTGNKYEGEWKYGFFHGKGTLLKVGKDPSSRTYSGEFKYGIENGQGNVKFKNGATYEGEWKDGRYNGTGTAIFTNGDKYVGESKDGLKDGQGSFFFNSDRSKLIGKFIKNEPWDATHFDENEEIICIWLNGIKQKK
jgi:hypothetical protein